MALYPLIAPRSSYRGSRPARVHKAAEQYRLAERVVAHINSQMERLAARYLPLRRKACDVPRRARLQLWQQCNVIR